MENLEFNFEAYYELFEQRKGWCFRQSGKLLLTDPRTGEKYDFRMICYIN